MWDVMLGCLSFFKGGAAVACSAEIELVVRECLAPAEEGLAGAFFSKDSASSITSSLECLHVFLCARPVPKMWLMKTDFSPHNGPADWHASGTHKVRKVHAIE